MTGSALAPGPVWQADMVPEANADVRGPITAAVLTSSHRVSRSPMACQVVRRAILGPVRATRPTRYPRGCLAVSDIVRRSRPTRTRVSQLFDRHASDSGPGPASGVKTSIVCSNPKTALQPQVKYWGSGMGRLDAVVDSQVAGIADRGLSTGTEYILWSTHAKCWSGSSVRTASAHRRLTGRCGRRC